MMELRLVMIIRVRMNRVRTTKMMWLKEKTMMT